MTYPMAISSGRRTPLLSGVDSEFSTLSEFWGPPQVFDGSRVNLQIELEKGSEIAASAKRFQQ